MTALPTADQFLTGGSLSAKFEKIGDTVSGVICEPPTVQQQTDFTSGAPQFWPDGNPKVQLAVTLQTDQHDPTQADDDGRRRVYIKNQMRQAVVEALRKANAKALEVGGTLTVTYSADGVAKQRGFNAPKQYTVQYQPPAVNEQAAFLSTPEPAQQQPAAPAAQAVSQFGG